MSLSDDNEKLRLAEEWLLDYPAHSQEFDAALEHVLITHKTREDLKSKCASILINVMQQRSDDKHTMAKLEAIK